MKKTVTIVSHFIKVAFLVAVVITSGCASTQSRSTVDQESAYHQHIKLALKYIGTNDRDLARVHLEKAARKKPRSAELYNAYALLYQIEQEFKLAEQHYKKALASDKSYTMARYNFAAFLFNQGRFSEARDEMEKVSQDLNYDRRPQAFYILGLAQNRLKERAAALESFEKATQLAAGFSPPYLEAAEIYFQQKDYALSRMALDRFKQMSEPTAQSLWLSVRLENHFGNRDNASSEGLKLKNLFPNSPENVQYQKWLKK